MSAEPVEEDGISIQEESSFEILPYCDENDSEFEILLSEKFELRERSSTSSSFFDDQMQNPETEIHSTDIGLNSVASFMSSSLASISAQTNSCQHNSTETFDTLVTIESELPVCRKSSASDIFICSKIESQDNFSNHVQCHQMTKEDLESFSHPKSSMSESEILTRNREYKKMTCFGLRTNTKTLSSPAMLYSKTDFDRDLNLKHSQISTEESFFEPKYSLTNSEIFYESLESLESIQTNKIDKTSNETLIDKLKSSPNGVVVDLIMPEMALNFDYATYDQIQYENSNQCLKSPSTDIIIYCDAVSSSDSSDYGEPIELLEYDTEAKSNPSLDDGIMFSKVEKISVPRANIQAAPTPIFWNNTANSLKNTSTTSISTQSSAFDDIEYIKLSHTFYDSKLYSDAITRDTQMKNLSANEHEDIIVEVGEATQLAIKALDGTVENSYHQIASQNQTFWQNIIDPTMKASYSMPQIKTIDVGKTLTPREGRQCSRMKAAMSKQPGRSNCSKKICELVNQSFKLCEWLRSNMYFRKVLHDAKVSLTSFANALDMIQKENFRNNRSLKVVIFAKEYDALAIDEAFREIFHHQIMISTVSMPENLVPALLIGYSSGIYAAEIITTYARDHHIVHDDTIILLAIPIIVEIIPQRWQSTTLLYLEDPKLKLNLHNFTQTTPIPNEYVIEAQRQTPDDYRWKGYGLSISMEECVEYIADMGSKDIQDFLTGTGRFSSVEHGGKVLAGMYKKYVTGFV